ncbi:MAG: hypothetical protein PHH30_04185 [Bacteroidales bacterium]|nr:hypothetical protein [Bacteroidales bacterium]MDD3859705.1 hypothetical protein [Bacteroidales bacterium]
MKKYLIILLIILSFNTLRAQFYVGFNTGYDISANRMEAFQKETPFILYRYYNRDTSIYLPLGEGFRNSISVGYKCNSLIFDLSLGGNFNAINLNYLNDANSFNYYDNPIINTLYDTAYVGRLFSPYFDEFMTFEYMVKSSIKYNIVSITQSVSYLTGKKDFHFLIKSGFHFNFVKIIQIVDFTGDFYSASSSGTYINSTNYLLKIDKPVISWLLGMGVSYDISDRLNLGFNIDYMPLMFSSVYREKLSLLYQIKVSDEIVYDLNETYDMDEEYEELWQETPRYFDFTTFDISVGLKYYFNFEAKGNESN